MSHEQCENTNQRRMMNPTTYNSIIDNQTYSHALFLDNIPDELKKYRQWVCWKTKHLEDGKKTKVPINPHTGTLASSTDPNTWSDYQKAIQTYQAGEALDGVGFVFTKDDPFCGIDLDKCRTAAPDSPSDALYSELAQRHLKVLNTYCEVSPSGTGVKAIVKGKKCGPKCKNVKLNTEMYDHNRFFTITGRRLTEFPADIQERQDELNAIYKHWFPDEEKEVKEHKPQPNNVDDEELITMAKHSNDLFKALWEYDTKTLLASGKYRHDNDDETLDHSSLDLALCDKLAYWTGRDKERMDELFRQSALYRQKWERRSYAQGTIDKACEGCETVYEDGQLTPHQMDMMKSMAVEFNTTPSEDQDEDLDIFADDFMDGQKMDWLCHDFIGKGDSMLLAAPPKAGKLLLMQWFIQSLIYQKPFLGGETFGPTPVLYLDYEMKRGYFREWYEKQLGDRDRKLTSKYLLYRCRNGLKRNDKIIGDLPHYLTADWLLQKVERITEQFQQPGLVVIDTLRAAYRETPNLDPNWENSVSGMANFVRPITDVAHKTNWAIVVLHHTNKAGGYSGSTEATAGSDHDCCFWRDVRSGSNICTISLNGRFDKMISDRVATFNGTTFDFQGTKEQWEKNKRKVNELDGMVSVISNIGCAMGSRTLSTSELDTMIASHGVGQNKARSMKKVLQTICEVTDDTNEHGKVKLWKWLDDSPQKLAIWQDQATKSGC